MRDVGAFRNTATQRITAMDQCARFVILATLGLLGCLSSAAWAQRPEIRIEADRIAAPGLQADTPTPGQWWLNRAAHDWKASQGTVLMTGRPAETQGDGGFLKVEPADQFVPYQVPQLEVDPQLTGWYRIFLGLYHKATGSGDRLLARLSREPYPEYLQTPVGAQSRIVEVYWKAAELTGQKILLQQVAAPTPHPGFGFVGGVDYIRLVPMSSAEVAAARRELTLPPRRQRLVALLDYTTEVFWEGTARTEDDMRAIVYRHQQAGFGRVYWRCYGTFLDHSSAVPEAAPRWTAADERRWSRNQKSQAAWQPYIDLTRRFDPLRVAVEYGKQHGVEVHAMVRFMNYNREPYSNFWHDNKQFHCLYHVKADERRSEILDRPRELFTYPRVLSLAYPEVRAYYVKFFKQIAATGTPGILIDLLRWPPIAGYDPIVIEAFQKKYGEDMRRRHITRDRLVHEHLSGYLRQFLVDVRKEIGNEIQIAVRCDGPDKFAFKGQQWIEEGLVNAIFNSGSGGSAPRSSITASLAAAGQRGAVYAVVHANSDVDPRRVSQARKGLLTPASLQALAGHYSGRGIRGVGIYESSISMRFPEMRRAIRAAGWEYDPDRNDSPQDK